MPGQSGWAKEFLETVCRDVLELGLMYTVEAHPISETAGLHRDSGPLALSTGCVGFFNAYLQWLQNYYLVRSLDDRLETHNIFWRFDNSVRVPALKGWAQAVMVVKVGGTKDILDVRSRKPLTAGSGFRSLLRASENHFRAAKGLRDSLLKYPETDEGGVLRDW